MDLALQGCLPSHFINHSPLRQSKLLAGQTFTPLQLVASHLRGWGRRLKRTTSSSFALRLTSERVHSTITVGVPALISFGCLCVPVSCLIYLFINLRKKRRQIRIDCRESLYLPFITDALSAWKHLWILKGIQIYSLRKPHV